MILDAAAVERTVARLSHEIIEKNIGDDTIYLVGIYRRGISLAEKLAKNIREFTGAAVEIGELDISLYRDDKKAEFDQPKVTATKIAFPVEGKNIVLVDDVLYTGRTVRAAIEALISLGRPASIQLAILVDRGHRELPIRGDYVGKNLPTSRSEFVSVRMPEFDGECSVVLIKPDSV